MYNQYIVTWFELSWNKYPVGGEGFTTDPQPVRVELPFLVGNFLLSHLLELNIVNFKRGSGGAAHAAISQRWSVK